MPLSIQGKGPEPLYGYGNLRRRGEGRFLVFSNLWAGSDKKVYLPGGAVKGI